MPVLILLAALAAILAGCAAYPSASCAPHPYRSETGSPCDWSRPYYGDRYWPPVDPDSAFPPQIMDGKGRR